MSWTRLCLVALGIGLGLGTSARAGSIWVEGESADKKDVTRHPWYDVVHKEGMSGGDWLSHYDNAKPGVATYKFDSTEAGDFTFWWRGNTYSKVSYKLNDGEMKEMSFADKRGEFMISDKPDHRSLAWIKVGKATLLKGENTLTMTFHGEIANSGGVDCFCFDNTGFVPSGALKPKSLGTSAAADAHLAGPDEAIWIEGEAADKKDVTKHGWYDAVHKEGMSGGDWLSHYDIAKPGTASYDFKVTKADSYTFWWRGNTWSKVSYKLDNGAAKEIEFVDRRGEYIISDKPDHRFLAWIKVGRIGLSVGDHTITFTIHGDISNSGGIDCFCFTRVPFTPSGTNKPGTASVVATSVKPRADEWFPVVFDADQFSPNSITDMSKLVESPAGAHGFLQRDADHLRFEKSKDPIQFWGCNANLQGAEFSHELLTQRARYLRKAGINMIRQHPVYSELGPLNADGTFDAKKLDAFDWWCAELKKQGIYMTWSVFYSYPVGPDDGYDPKLFNELEVVDPTHNLRSTSGLVNIERQLQDLQLKYLRPLLLHKNPYTGLRPVDDPELAVLEFHNEDCIFFYNPLSGLAGNRWPLHSQRLRAKFFEWANIKYGSQEGVKKAWGRLRGGDSWGKKELEIAGAWEMGEDGGRGAWAGETTRMGDYIHFLTDLQRGFYERREKEVRELGFKAVTITTAWRAGGAAGDPANLYCDTAADMIDRHNYLGGGAGGHGIAAGVVNNESHLPQPGSGLLSIGMYQVEDRPFSCTEWTQLPPNQWKVEAAPLIAFYGMGLQGWDASYQFLNTRAYPGDGWPGLSSYSMDTPHYVGQFPALAFALYHHHIQQGPPAAIRHLKTTDLFSGIDPLRQDFTGGGYDSKSIAGKPATPLEALAMGRVTVAFDDKKSASTDFGKYWDKSAKTVQSMTGQLTWDYGRQLVTVHTPRTQAILGRASGAGEIDLPGVSATVKTPFVSMIFTPLDDTPLAESHHILVTAMARDMQTNTQYSGDGKQLLAIGGPPLLMEPVQATLKLKGTAPKSINTVDVYGVPTATAVPVGADGSFTVSGEYKSYYYEVKR